MSKRVQDPGYDRVRELGLRLTEQEQVQRTGSTHPSSVTRRKSKFRVVKKSFKMKILLASDLTLTRASLPSVECPAGRDDRHRGRRFWLSTPVLRRRGDGCRGCWILRCGVTVIIQRGADSRELQEINHLLSGARFLRRIQGLITGNIAMHAATQFMNLTSIPAHFPRLLWCFFLRGRLGG